MPDYYANVGTGAPAAWQQTVQFKPGDEPALAVVKPMEMSAPMEPLTPTVEPGEVPHANERPIITRPAPPPLSADVSPFRQPEPRIPATEYAFPTHLTAPGPLLPLTPAPAAPAPSIIVVPPEPTSIGLNIVPPPVVVAPPAQTALPPITPFPSPVPQTVQAQPLRALPPQSPAIQAPQLHPSNQSNQSILAPFTQPATVPAPQPTPPPAPMMALGQQPLPVQAASIQQTQVVPTQPLVTLSQPPAMPHSQRPRPVLVGAKPAQQPAQPPAPKIAPPKKHLIPMPLSARQKRIAPIKPVHKDGLPTISMPYDSGPAAMPLDTSPVALETPEAPRSVARISPHIYSQNTRLVWQQRRAIRIFNIVMAVIIMALFVGVGGYWFSLGSPTNLHEIPLFHAGALFL